MIIILWTHVVHLSIKFVTGKLLLKQDDVNMALLSIHDVFWNRMMWTWLYYRYTMIRQVTCQALWPLHEITWLCRCRHMTLINHKCFVRAFSARLSSWLSVEKSRYEKLNQSCFLSLWKFQVFSPFKIWWTHSMNTTWSISLCDHWHCVKVVYHNSYWWACARLSMF